MSGLAHNTRVFIAIPVLLIGGTEIHTLNLVKALTSQGYRISVCCYYDYDDAMVSEFREAGTEIILMELNKSAGLLSLFTKLIRLFREVKPDILHVQYLAPGLVPIIAARLAGVKRVFATVHQPGRPYGLKAKILIRIAAYLCDAFFCNSRAVEESWFGSFEIFDHAKNNGRRKHFTIYNGVDTERIEQVVQSAHKESIKNSLNINGKRVIGVVGRLRKEKGQIYILEAMRMIIREMPDAVLLMVGDGPDRQHLEEAAKKLGIEDHVKWLGQKDHDEVLRLYSIMDVVVVPSLFEGFGLTAVEAMAAGKPVVASKVDGLPEVIQDGVSGILVRPQDRAAISEAIIGLLTDSQRGTMMGVHGREMVQRGFSFSRFQRNILTVYSQPLESRTS